METATGTKNKQRENTPLEDLGLVYPSRRSVVGYCYECGTMVRLPCFACQIRELQKKNKPNKEVHDNNGDIK